MFDKNILLLVPTVLSLYSLTECVLLNRLVNTNESSECPTLCDDDIHIDAITPINLTPELLLISGKCAFIVDPRHSNVNQIRHGFKHSFAFSEIQDMFAIGNKTDIEFVTVYASGTIVQVIVANSTDTQSDMTRTNVFEGLSVDLNIPIDAAFVWTDQKIVYLIQGSKYWAFEMSQGWRKGGKQLESYPRNITDFGLKPEHRITSAFADSTKIYFLSMNLVYVYDISNIDSKTGLFKGRLSQKSIKLKDFLKCPAIESSADWKSSVRQAFTDISNTFDQYFDIIFISIAMLVLIASMVLLVMSFIRYSSAIRDIKSKSFQN